MMTIAFSLYFLAMISMFARKRSLAIGWMIVGLLFAAFIYWFHATSTIGIRL